MRNKIRNNMPEPTPAPAPTQSFEEMANAAIEGIGAVAPTTDPIPAKSEPEPTPTPTPAVVPEPEPIPESDPLVSKLFGEPEEPTPSPTPPPEADLGDKPPGDKNTPGAQKAWAELRQDRKWRKENEPEFEKLKAKVAEFEKRPTGEDPQIAQLKTQAEQAMNLLRIRDVESTPEYAENITKPIQKMEEIAAGIAKKHELSVTKVLSALRETDSERQNELLADITEGLNDRDKSRIFSMTDQYGELVSKGKYLKDNAKVALEALMKDRTASQKKRMEDLTQARSGAIEAVGVEFAKTLMLLQPIEGQEVWNQGITQINELAKKVQPEVMHPVARAKLIYQGLMLPRAMELLEKMSKDYKSTRLALNKYRKATPGGGDPNPNPAPGSEDLGKLGFLDAMERQLHKK